jgi:eukaryotic-like serine/threonine-protein kinase
MSGERWERLSAWYNAWLEADPAHRARLEARIASEEPALADQALGLAAAGGVAADFLDTPAVVVAARELSGLERPLGSGVAIGPYHITGLLAHGGMGDVYRATDVRLERDVALKVLNTSASSDPDRIDRFVQEARITAALDHPNIVRIQDVGMAGERLYLVQELLEGDTLAHRIGQGPLPIVEAVRIGREIAAGLAVAHAAGVVHRDVKPANVFLTQTGCVKILDFGIAKLTRDDLPRDAVSTLTGVLLGTVGYLAPEQVRGEPVDGRTDLFALGAVLFEMLTGTRAFARPHTVETLYAIVHHPAPDLRELRPDVSPALAAVVARLLEKSADARFQTAGDLEWILERVDGIPNRPAQADTPRVPTGRRRWRAAAALAAIGVVVALGWRAMMQGETDPPPSPGGVTQFSWPLPDNLSLDSPPVLSPDGRQVAFSAVESGRRQLMVRHLAERQAAVVPGTEGALQPFWSPDGTALGFFAQGKLMRVTLPDGAPVALADAPGPRGGTWGTSGTIVFQPFFRDTGLARVPASGGRVEPVTVLDADAGETTHRWPVFLPDGRHVLYVVSAVSEERRGLFLASLDRPPSEAVRLMPSSLGAVFAPGDASGVGFLLSAGAEYLEARRLDLRRMTLAGDPVTLPVAAAPVSPHHGPLLSVTTGILAFASPQIPAGAHVTVTSRDGGEPTIASERTVGGFFRLSPDGRRLARARLDPTAMDVDIWVEDRERGSRVRITASRDLDIVPVWSPEGSRVAFRTGRWSAPKLGFVAADGSGGFDSLPCPAAYCEPTDWSLDGRTLIVNVGPGDVWQVPVDGTPATPLLAEPFVERDARIAPDGRWLAYVSEESGRPEVSVRSLVGPARRYVVSTGGGDQPVWRRDGRELFFTDLRGHLQSVSVRGDATGGLIFGMAIPMAVPAFGERHWGTIYDVAPDGRTVYFPHAGTPARPRELHFILNWEQLVGARPR